MIYITTLSAGFPIGYAGASLFGFVLFLHVAEDIVDRSNPMVRWFLPIFCRHGSGWGLSHFLGVAACCKPDCLPAMLWASTTYCLNIHYSLSNSPPALILLLYGMILFLFGKCESKRPIWRPHSSLVSSEFGNMDVYRAVVTTRP